MPVFGIGGTLDRNRLPKQAPANVYRHLSDATVVYQ